MKFMPYEHNIMRSLFGKGYGRPVSTEYQEKSHSMQRYASR